MDNIGELAANIPLPAILATIAILLVTYFFVFSEPKTKTFYVAPPKESDIGWKEGKILSNPRIRDPANPNTIICYDPATGRHLASIPNPKPSDVTEALASAREAQKEWAKTTYAQRKAVLRSILEFVMTYQEDIARVSCRDTGKTMIDACLGEILTVCSKLRWTLDYGEKTLADSSRETGLLMMYKNAKVIYQPLGVVAALVSWNYPFHNTVGPVISAIFAGNGIIVKSSEYVAWSNKYWEDIVREALRVNGHNPNLVHFITGFADVGEAVVQSGVDHITFIGSPEVGQIIMRNASANLTPVTLELGGKDCAVILKDADLGQAIPVLMRGVFQNVGQNCIGIERILVDTNIYDKFVAEMDRRIATLRLGSALEEPEGVDCGAMTMGTTFDQIESLIQEAISKGARLLHGGKRYQHPKYPSGQYFAPTLLVDVTQEMQITHKEVFGPIMLIMRFSDPDHAVELVNSSPYGLGSSVFGGNIRFARSIALRLRAGMTNINDFAVNYLCQSLPFGGVGISGFNRFGGPEGLRSLCIPKAYTEDKVSFIKTPIPPVVDYPIKNTRKGYVFTRELVRFTYGTSLLEKLKGGANLGAAAI